MQRAILAALVLGGILSACGDKNVFVPDPVIDPIITSVSPAQGTVGTEVRIEGTGFQAGVGVRCGTIPATSVLCPTSTGPPADSSTTTVLSTPSSAASPSSLSTSGTNADLSGIVTESPRQPGSVRTRRAKSARPSSVTSKRP